MATMIYFSGRETGILVDGAAEEVAQQMTHRGPVRFTTVDGSVIFVNWANVLYITETPTPSSV